MSDHLWVRIAAPAATDLGLEPASWLKLGTLTSWSMREVLLRGRGYLTLVVIAAVFYLIIFGLPVAFLATPWRNLFDAAADNLFGIPWAELAQMAITALLRGMLCVLIATVVVTLAIAIRWGMLLASPEIGTYTDSTFKSVVTIEVRSREGEQIWSVGRHLSRRKHRGDGAQLREALRTAIVSDYRDLRLTIEARVTNEKFRALLQRQFPSVRVDGQVLRAKPIDLTLGDQLGRRSNPETLAAAMRERAFDGERGTITALVAPWGAGKSWILNHAAAILEFPPDGARAVRVLQFNPWLFADESSLFAGFAEVILKEVRGWRARRKVVRVLKLIGPASKYGPIDLGPAASLISGMIEPASSPSSVFRTLDRAISKSNKPICIVMDDIDRLNPDELTMLFKLIRLVGNLRGVSYLLAMDEDTVLQLIGSTKIADSNPERARAYLEKIIDFKHRVPPLTFEQIHDRGFEEVAGFAKENGIVLHRRSYESLEWVYDQSLSRRLTTVRAIDRFLSEVKSISPTLFGEIDFKDWCLSAFLRSQMPTVWTFVIDHKNEFLGRRSGLTFDMGTEATNQFTADMPSTLRSLGLSAEGVEVAIDVLTAMFPAIDLAGGSILMARSTLEESEFRLGIGHADYFDRYTWIGLPPTDVSDRKILTLLRELADVNTFIDARRALRSIYDAQPNTVLDRIRRNQDQPGIAKLALFKFLASVLPRRDTLSALFSRERSPVVLATGSLIVSLDEHDLDAAFTWAVEPDGTAEELFIEVIQRRGFFWHSSSPIEARMQEVQEILLTRLRNRLEIAPCPTIDDFPQREFACDLLRIDSTGFGELAGKLIDDGSWRADDVIALFISTFLPGTDTMPFHTGVSARKIRAALGDDLILRLYPLGGVRQASRDCIAHEDNHDYKDCDVLTMRATAADAVAQIAQIIESERREQSPVG